MREKCPKCGSNGKKHRYGKTAKGTQRFRCCDCNSVYVAEIKYEDDFKMRAMKVYFEGVSGRAVGRVMGISKGIIWYWMKQYVRKIEEKSDGNVKIAELDELYTYIKKDKSSVFNHRNRTFPS